MRVMEFRGFPAGDKVIVLSLLCCACLSYAQEDAFVEGVLARMTLEEKVGQLIERDCARGCTDPLAGDGTLKPTDPELLGQIARGEVGALLGACGIENYNAYQRAALSSRCGIPLMAAADLIHGCRTTYPIPLGMSASWDEDLWRRGGELISREAPLVGCNWTLTPMVDIALDARWGRIAESPGQDPRLAARFAAATVRGIQRMPSPGCPRVAATLKHFVAYGACVGGRDYDAADMSDGTLHDIYLPPFRGGVDAGALTVMPAFLSYNGVPVSVNRYLLTDVLRGELGFGGFCISDMGAIGECGPAGHAVAEKVSDVAALAVQAGLDMDMERRKTRAYADGLLDACRSGKVPMSVLDARVRAVLSVKRRLGLFENPLIDEKRAWDSCDIAAHKAFAREAATKCAVLLKNDRETLPLPRKSRIALVGAASANKKLIYGTWTAFYDNADRLTVEEGLRDHGADVTFVEAYGRNGSPDDIDERALEEACVGADVVVGCFGIGRAGGEAASLSDLSLVTCERRAAEIIDASGKPFVAVLFTGVPVCIPDLAERADAILEMWGAGSSGGVATADLLLGVASPSGRLTCDFPFATGQCPIYYHHLPSGRPTDENYRFSRRYKDGPTRALYSFGYGLAYTRFDYRDECVREENGRIVVSCTVRNVGSREGVEIVQLYLRRLFDGKTHPVRELMDFRRLTLQPGEASTASFALDVPAGVYDAFVCPNSRAGSPLRFVKR